jgi:glycosyltransferase involved in cell wall biosynthesis
MRIAILNLAWDPALTDPDALLAQYYGLTDWAEVLQSAGADAVVVGQRFGRDATIVRGGVTYRFACDSGPGRPGLLTGIARLLARLANECPDVVHINGLGFPRQTCEARWRLPGAALVLQDHKDGFHRDPARRAVLRLGLARADAFFFTTPELADPWRAAGLIGPHQPVYAIVGASTALTRNPDPRVALPGRPACLWVGRLVGVKDPLSVLDGFERAAVEIGDAHLTFMFQNDELLPAVQARIARSPILRPRVHLAGAIAHDDLAEWYSAADLFVLGSHQEGSGFALVEAMACGAVPVVTDIPAFRGITGGRAGALWTPGRADELASALVRMARSDLDRARRDTLDQFARHLARPAIGRRAMDAYQEVVDRRRREIAR